MIKKLLLPLMLIVTATATMSAQDEPMEQTSIPNICLQSIETDDSYYYAVIINNSDEDPDADLFYRYSFNGEEFSEWMPYEDVLFFDIMGNYQLQVYAQAEGKSPSDVIGTEFTIAEPTHMGTYDFKEDDNMFTAIAYWLDSQCTAFFQPDRR